MSWTVKVSFIFMVFLSSWLMQEQAQARELTRVSLKNAANRAAHDSLMAIDYSMMGAGLIAFNAVEAREMFEESLARNLGLDKDLSPKEKSLVLSSVKVLKFELVDHLSHDFEGNGGFIVYEDSAFRLYKVLRGPAVVAVIEVDSPSVGVFSGDAIRASVITEYVPYR